MKNKEDIQVLENDFNQKKINHIVHYLDNFEFLLRILKNGFAPSYCLEKINDFEYYIPMVSFCNIPFKDVDQYMRYGKYGIGMSLEWALKNSISPVVYIHEATPFREFNSKLHKILLIKQSPDYEEITNLTIPAVQFFKNWKTIYKGKEIITYHEREWRYIPQLKNEKLIDKDSFQSLKKDKFKKKPHLPEHILKFGLEDLRYVVINNDIQRKKVLNTLINAFGNQTIVDAVLSGQLMIINDDLIRNDF